MRIDYHRTLIADRVRNAAFKAALAALIRPGETIVADIGAGTGLLGLIAARLGAREVFLYETAEVAGVAAEVLKRNKVRNGHVIPCHSTEMQDPPRVDLIVSETLGNYPFEEDIIETLNDARARFLKPGGVVVPSGLEQFVAPVVSDRIHRELSVWDEVGDSLDAGLEDAEHGQSALRKGGAGGRGLAGPIDLSPARALSFNNAYVRTLAPPDLLGGMGAAKRWDSIAFSARNRATRQGEAAWPIRRPVAIYGFATWWTAELAPAVALSTAPDAPRTHWEQLYFPLDRPLDMAAGETLAVSLRSRSSIKAGTHLAWTATRTGASGRQIERRAHDLDKGYLP